MSKGQLTLADSIAVVADAARDVEARYGQAGASGIIVECLIVGLSAMENSLRMEIAKADEADDWQSSHSD